MNLVALSYSLGIPHVVRDGAGENVGIGSYNQRHQSEQSETLFENSAKDGPLFSSCPGTAHPITSDCAATILPITPPALLAAPVGMELRPR